MKRKYSNEEEEIAFHAQVVKDLVNRRPTCPSGHVYTGFIVDIDEDDDEHERQLECATPECPTPYFCAICANSANAGVMIPHEPGCTDSLVDCFADVMSRRDLHDSRHYYKHCAVARYVMNQVPENYRQQVLEFEHFLSRKHFEIDLQKEEAFVAFLKTRNGK